MKKRTCVVFFILIILCPVIYFSFSYFSERKIKSQPLYNIVNDFYFQGNIPSPKDISLTDERETSFIQGASLYFENNIEEAETVFKNISFEEKNLNPVLNLYLNVFLNRCEIKKTGHGNLVYIENIFNIMQNYSIFAEDTDLIWEMISSSLNDTASRKKIISLLDNLIKNCKKLSLEDRLRIKGFSAIIKMTDGEYGESIYTYYEILSQSEKIKDYEVRSKMQIKAYEYLGNMYFILEDFNSAVKYYTKAVSLPMKNSETDALVKYGAYINLSESYIQLKNFQKAWEYSLKTEKLIKYLPENIAVGVKIFRYKNLLLLESYRHNFEKAQEYYNLCLELLKKDMGSAFINTKMYVDTAYCEFLIQQGKYYEAIEKLNILLAKEEKEKWGFDSTIYIMLLNLYKETKQINLYFETEQKIYNLEKEFTEVLKKDYLEFVKNSYTLDQLKVRERENRLKIITLSGLSFAGILLITVGILLIFNLKKKNYTDILTNVYNRKYLDFVIKQKIKTPFNAVIIMADIDYFKQYNDFYGHPAGDNVIRKTAEILKKNIRKDDIVIRYGGEEFLIILKNCSLDVFKNIYDKTAEILNAENIAHEKSLVSDRITLSMGAVSQILYTGSDIKEAVKKADKALYLSKYNGRNRYTIYE